MALSKAVTTVGRPGVQVASIIRRPGRYLFAHVEGPLRLAVNDRQVVDAKPVHLNSGDRTGSPRDQAPDPTDARI